MKALILAAGFGTRLLPHTLKTPKPLFTLLSKPMLEHAIDKLVDIGCDQILINTHHLHQQIESFLNQLDPRVEIQTLHEPVILDTGGAIANARSFLSDTDFFVINADIFSDIDLKQVYHFHKKTAPLATLVLHDHETFNCVKTNEKGYIENFNATTQALAFTGIQVLSPDIFNHLPEKKIFSSIELYQTLCPHNLVKAFVAKDIFWSDIGTPESYGTTSLLKLAAFKFKITEEKIKDIRVEPLAGDGSDRKWFRAVHDHRSFILSDHGICPEGSDARRQLNAFVRIGHHLFSKEIPVPRIYTFDALSGMVILEDLGDVHLETLIKQHNDRRLTQHFYQRVIDLIIDFSIKGFEGFNKEWTCQTATYSKALILQGECRYFIEAFVQNYLQRDVSYHAFSDEFERIADHVLKNSFTGLMHRDMQSRNIMVKKNQIYFIDFQSARLGPVQYDLASLLIDPYVQLDLQIQSDLIQYTVEKLKLTSASKQRFLTGYQYCCLTRNMQFLGAFSFLSQTKKKKQFERYIPDAIHSLKNVITGLNTDLIPKLAELVQTL